MSPATRLLPILGIAVAGVAVFFLWPSAGKDAPASRTDAIPVHMVRAELNTNPELIRAIGQVRSQHEVAVRPQIDGQLVELRAREGQRVRRGELLARIDDRAIQAALSQARAQLAMTHAQLRSAQQDLERYQALLARQAVSAQMLEQQKARVAELEAATQAQQAQVDAQEVQLSYTRLYAPTDGYVGLRRVDEGNFIHASDSEGLFSVTRLDPISVEIALPQALLPSLQRLMQAEAPAIVRAYAGGGGTPLGQGRLVALDNRVTRETGTIRVKADFDNPDGMLWPGQSVSIALEAGMQSGTLALPQMAVRQGLDGSFVYRVRDGKAEVVPVTLAYVGDGIAVVTGLEAGDQIVAEGHSRLRHGASVRDSRAPTETAAQGDTP